MSARAFLAAVIAAGTPLESASDAGDGSELPGAPAHPAPDGASLSSVFEEIDGVSFDEFFGETAPKQDKPEGTKPSEPKRDDDGFKDWLKGLKS
jgi:hypothetical protein